MYMHLSAQGSPLHGVAEGACVGVGVGTELVPPSWWRTSATMTIVRSVTAMMKARVLRRQLSR